jgi:glucose-6-phosphate-specific signal transduction histidine kinase
MTEMTNKLGPLDSIERAVRLMLGAALLLLAWGYGWSGVDGIGALTLGAIALATALAGSCPADRALARLDR